MGSEGKPWFRLDAPGNLLLSGEYAIVEAGGQGIALAVDNRASLICRPYSHAGQGFSFRGIWPGAGGVWESPPQTASASDWQRDPAMPPLLAAIIGELIAYLGQQGLDGGRIIAEAAGGQAIEVETLAFFDAQGRKLGLGSSAAACLLVTAAFCCLIAPRLTANASTVLNQAMAQLAVDSHRRLQGGKGSGYDILCSLGGGLSLFIGGPQPSAQPLEFGLLEPIASFCLVSGPRSVRSGPSIENWRKWAAAHPQAAADYRQGCVQRAQSLVAGKQNLPEIINAAKIAGIELGDAIGISARYELPAPLDPQVCLSKALGAGNETILVAAPEPYLKHNLPRQPILRPAHNGLQSGRILAETSAQGKLLLWGEHVALWGWPAVGLPLPQFCQLCLAEPSSATPPGQIEVWLNGQALSPLEAAEFKELLGLSIQLAGAVNFPATAVLGIVSTVPRSGGYGSSAALCAALARLVSQFAPNKPNELSLWQLANNLDGHFHGRASGIDTGLALASAPLVFSPRDTQAIHPEGLRLTQRPLRWAPGSAPIYLVHAAQPRLAGTKALVAGIAQRLAAADPTTRAQIDRLGSLSHSAIQALEQGSSPASLGELATAAQAVLNQLGVGDPAIDRLISLGTQAGALGGKLSGAGGGGAFFLICDSQSQAEIVRQALQSAGASAEISALPMQEAL